MTSPLQAESERFAADLTNLIQGCIAGAPRFCVVEAKDSQQLSIGPAPMRTEESGRSLEVSGGPGAARLGVWLTRPD